MAQDRFRELIQPGSNFEFMGRAKLWFAISIIVCSACIGMLFVNKAWRGDYMNWSTDFKGGTEMIFGFYDKKSGQPIEVDAGQARKALEGGAFEGFDVSEYTWTEQRPEGTVEVQGMMVRTPHFGAVPVETQERVTDEFVKQFASIQPLKLTWSGDNIHVRSMKAVSWEAARDFLAKHGLTLKPWDKEEEARAAIGEEGTGEHNAQLSVVGIEGQYQAALQRGLGEAVDVRVTNAYGVGAKAGSKLRDDGITSMFFAMILIMLYLAVRFDIRYSPGAVVAMLHDGIVVVGAFALTWQEFSLTTVAALLTIIGYSVNDTVIIFDRIRENTTKLKDKKFIRIMNISINETLSRSLLTSLTVFVTTLMMNIFGTGLVRNFAFAMNVGVIIGSYSSVFIAAPVALWVHNRFYERSAAASRPVPGRAKSPESESDEDEGEDSADERV